MSDAEPSAKLTFKGKTYDLPVIQGALGPDVIDISKLYAEGKVFTFQGIGGVTASRPLLGFIPPQAPSTASLRVVNQARNPVLVYSLDRYGGWNWEAELPPGRAFSATAAVGQRWRVTNLTNIEMESITIRPGPNSIAINAAPAIRFTGVQNEKQIQIFRSMPALIHWCRIGIRTTNDATGCRA